MQQEIEQSNTADGIGKDSRNRNTRHAQAKTRHQNQVQHHIHCTCHHEHIERTLRIALAAQDCRDKVVDHGKGHSHKVDLQVKHGVVQDIGRSRDGRKNGMRE